MASMKFDYSKYERSPAMKELDLFCEKLENGTLTIDEIGGISFNAYHYRNTSYIDDETEYSLFELRDEDFTAEKLRTTLEEEWDAVFDKHCNGAKETYFRVYTKKSETGSMTGVSIDNVAFIFSLLGADGMALYETLKERYRQKVIAEDPYYAEEFDL